MNYVEHLNLFGIEAKEIPCITGSGVPTTATVAAVGMFYMDTSSGDVYKCTAVSGNVYTWEPMNSGMTTLVVTIDSDTNTASHRPSEINDVVNNGGYAVLFSGTSYSHLAAVTSLYANFERLLCEGDHIVRCINHTIKEDGTIVTSSYNHDSGGNVDLTGVVKSVNGVTPDENGNVDVDAGGSPTDEQVGVAINARLSDIIDGVLEQMPVVGVVDADNNITIYGELNSGEYFLRYENDDGSTVDIGSLSVVNDSEPDEPDTEKTLTSISVVYSGGSVDAGTSVNNLTGIVVTAHYSDGTSEAVTGYTLSGTVAEGNNTITVSYGEKIATFDVTGKSIDSVEPDTPDEGDGTNQIPISTDDAGNIYNGVGYMTAKRLDSAGSVNNITNVNATNVVFVTGIIPAELGDTVRLKNCYIATVSEDAEAFLATYGHPINKLNISFRDSGKALIKRLQWDEIGGSNTYVSDAIIDSDNNLTGFTIANDTVAYIRLTLAPTGNVADAIVTVSKSPN